MSLRDLPRLRKTIQTPQSPESKTDPEATAFYDVKPCPYQLPSDNPIFAVTGTQYTVVFQCHPAREPVVDDDEGRDIRWFGVGEYKGTHESLNSLAWARTRDGKPLLCVTGKKPVIDVMDPFTGDSVQTLTGSGADVNDLATCPTDSTILASCSMDLSVKLWTLDPAHNPKYLAAKCLGHQENVIAITWHPSGNYLLSGGMDTKINLWHIPPFRQEELGNDKPRLIHYPHFSSVEVHSDYPDCFQFCGDNVLSRCAKENRILLWRIDSFNSRRKAPDAPIPPSQVVRSETKVVLPLSQKCGTWSAWGGSYQRLLSFNLSHSESWYIRFNVFNGALDQANVPPVLVAGNQEGTLSFWDLHDVEQYPSSAADARARQKRSNRSKGSSVIRPQSEYTSSAAAEDTDEGYTTTGSRAPKRKGRKRQKKVKSIPPQILGDPFQSLEPQKQITINRLEGRVFKPDWTVRQVAWSQDGRVCVAVGDKGMIAILTRWEDGVPDG
ncbi:WD40-repeat-containing domain protein [Lophiotrema nucula]|uniref:WD40-repeat-containing domain protein n=1 Tax=Lophiotrema nucula TaxID=690887 RepID=A0A6A5Z204_9PLEO|nr:WD40-repeat-containing domain protein [Lophiotrema nucula]